MTPPPCGVGAVTDIVNSSRTSFVGTLIFTTWVGEVGRLLILCGITLPTLCSGHRFCIRLSGFVGEA